MGLRDAQIQTKLIGLTDNTLTFDKAVDMAQIMEKAQIDSISIQEKIKSEGTSVSIHKLDKNGFTRNQNNKEFLCFRCGLLHKNISDCQHKNSVCNYCTKVGHLSKVCMANPNASVKFPKKFRSVSNTLTNKSNIKSLDLQNSIDSNDNLPDDASKGMNVINICTMDRSSDIYKKIILPVKLMANQYISSWIPELVSL